jgi:hypothetical protein
LWNWQEDLKRVQEAAARAPLSELQAKLQESQRLLSSPLTVHVTTNVTVEGVSVGGATYVEDGGGRSGDGGGAVGGTVGGAIRGSVRGGGGGESCGVQEQWLNERPDHEFKYIGKLGEIFVHSILSRHLPGFDETCWLSVLNPMSAIDFRYRDVGGVFAGAERKGAVCFIDVKATKWDSPKLGPIISEQQWAKARLVHRMPGRQALFAIVWVWDVRSEAPKYEI